jgi:hypothetical protein
MPGDYASDDVGSARRRRLAHPVSRPVGQTDAEHIRQRLAEEHHGIIRVFGTAAELPPQLNMAALRITDGRIGLLVRPGARRPSWQWRDLLATVGVTGGAGDPGQDLDEDEPVVVAWLAAHRPTDIVVASAQLLEVAHLRALIVVCVASGARIWLLTTPLTNKKIAELDNWSAHPISWATFATAWADVPHLFSMTHHDPIAEPADEPFLPAPLPAADFPTFLSSCEKVLDPDTLAWVRRTFGADLDAAQTWASALGVEALDAQTVSTFLLDRYDRCGADGSTALAYLASLVNGSAQGPARASDLLRQLNRGAGDEGSLGHPLLADPQDLVLVDGHSQASHAVVRVNRCR